MEWQHLPTWDIQKAICIFQRMVCVNKSSDHGLISSHQQQMLKLQQRMCPRHFFIKDFVCYVQSLHITADNYIIVMMDANEQIGRAHV